MPIHQSIGRLLSTGAIIALLSMALGCGDTAGPKGTVTQATDQPAVHTPHEPLDAELTPDDANSAPAVDGRLPNEQRQFLSRVFGTLYERVAANGLQQLSEHTRDLYVVQYFRQEFELGGLEYYFYNTAANHASETVQALRVMNAPEVADALQAAFHVFPDGQPSREVAERQDVLDELTTDQQALLAKLDEQLAPLVTHLPSRERDFIRSRDIRFDFRN